MTDRTLKPVALKPCPFCGRHVSDDLSDTLYPSGLLWREAQGIRHYLPAGRAKPGDRPVWQMVCPVPEGGCGAEILGDSRDEAIAKWNTRPAPTDEEIRRIAEGVERAVYEWQVKGPAGGCLDVIKAAIRKVIC